MAKPRLSCREVQVFVEMGVFKSGDVAKLARQGVISMSCAEETRLKIARKIQMNGRRRK